MTTKFENNYNKPPITAQQSTKSWTLMFDAFAGKSEQLGVETYAGMNEICGAITNVLDTFQGALLSTEREEGKAVFVINIPTQREITHEKVNKIWHISKDLKSSLADYSPEISCRIRGSATGVDFIIVCHIAPLVKHKICVAEQHEPVIEQVKTSLKRKELPREEPPTKRKFGIVEEPPTKRKSGIAEEPPTKRKFGIAEIGKGVAFFSTGVLILGMGLSLT